MYGPTNPHREPCNLESKIPSKKFGDDIQNTDVRYNKEFYTFI